MSALFPGWLIGYVVVDRLTMELPQFGKLAYDLHIGQDNKSLSAIEDAFYVLSDRKPCMAIQAAAAAATSSHRATAVGAGKGLVVGDRISANAAVMADFGPGECRCEVC